MALIKPDISSGRNPNMHQKVSFLCVHVESIIINPAWSRLNQKSFPVCRRDIKAPRRRDSGTAYSSDRKYKINSLLDQLLSLVSSAA